MSRLAKRLLEKYWAPEHIPAFFSFQAVSSSKTFYVSFDTAYVSLKQLLQHSLKATTVKKCCTW